MFASKYDIVEDDLRFINKIIENNNSFFSTKIHIEHLEDIFAKVLYSLIGKEIQRKGIFIPAQDFKVLADDKTRLDKLAILGYPVEIKDTGSILEFLSKYTSELRVDTIEKIIRDKWVRRRLSEVSYKLSEDITNSNKSPEELLRRYSTELDSLMYDVDEDREIYTTNDIYQTECNYLNSPSQMFSKTGTIIDNENGGLCSPSLVVIVAGAKVGKSLMLYNSAIASLREGRKVLFVTIEIGADECKRKFLSSYTGVPFQDINKKILDENTKLWYLRQCKQFADDYEDKFYIYYNKSGVCAKDIEIYYNNLLKAGIQIDDIYIDYMYIMKSNTPNAPMVEALGNLPKELRILSQKTDTRVFSAMQLRAEAEAKEIEKIHFDDIYFMKNLAFEATYTLLLKNNHDMNTINAKCLPSRQVWSNQVYYYPQLDKSRLYMGEAEIFDTNMILKSNSFF